MNDAQRCSNGSVEAGEQLAGSAPHAVAWLALEQSGPWGPKAFTGSHLDPALGLQIEDVAAAHGVRPSLIRRPGRHADDHLAQGDDSRRVLVAHTAPGRSWLLEGTVADPADVLAVDWPALRDGDQDAVRRSLPTLAASERAHLLVCTNGTRDLCCAAKGRPVALGLSTLHPDRVWEVTHTSGHRFAATAVLLPAGTLHGHLDVGAAEQVLLAADRGETLLPGSRGRSTWSPAGQVAELAVRDATGIVGLDALSVESAVATGDHAWEVTVAHADGRRWQVTVASKDTGAARAESCGKSLVALRRWTTRL
ncbi:MAG: sucrase ferredoxin [Nocardioides sp.]